MRKVATPCEGLLTYYRDGAEGKRKSTGKGGKGGGKCGGKGGGKAAIEKFVGKCNYCQKTGHNQQDCRKKAYNEKNKVGGKHANAIAADIRMDACGKDIHAITRDDSDDEHEFFCVTCELAPSVAAVDRAPQEVAAMSGSTFVTLDTAGDCHCAPTTFGEGAD